jgi:hypothetical protein
MTLLPLMATHSRPASVWRRARSAAAAYLTLLLASNVVCFQPGRDAQQLATALQQEFGVPFRVDDGGQSQNLFIYTGVAPAYAKKYSVADQRDYAWRIARFAREHSTLGHNARYIAIGFTVIRNDGGRRVRSTLGTWAWESHSLDDSGAVPDLLKGSRPRQPEDERQ